MWKITILRKKIILFQICFGGVGGARRMPPLPHSWIRPWRWNVDNEESARLCIQMKDSYKNALNSNISNTHS